jgi:hypothetical protein
MIDCVAYSNGADWFSDGRPKNDSESVLQFFCSYEGFGPHISQMHLWVFCTSTSQTGSTPEIWLPWPIMEWRGWKQIPCVAVWLWAWHCLVVSVILMHFQLSLEFLHAYHDHTCLGILAFSLFFFVFFSFWSLGLWSSLWPRNICLTAEFAFWALGDHNYCCFSLEFSAWLIRDAHDGYICVGFFLIICELWIIVWQIKARFCVAWFTETCFCSVVKSSFRRSMRMQDPSWHDRWDRFVSLA